MKYVISHVSASHTWCEWRFEDFHKKSAGCSIAWPCNNDYSMTSVLLNHTLCVVWMKRASIPAALSGKVCHVFGPSQWADIKIGLMCIIICQCLESSLFSMQTIGELDSWKKCMWILNICITKCVTCTTKGELQLLSFLLTKQEYCIHLCKIIPNWLFKYYIYFGKSRKDWGTYAYSYVHSIPDSKHALKC